MADDTGKPATYTTFADRSRIASGPRDIVLAATKGYLDAGGDPVLIFEDETGRQVDFDFRGTVDEVLARASGAVRPGPGRPKLGVVSREISLLPRQWDWLEDQPNGISAAIRRLVDEARKNETGIQRGRRVRDAVNKFMWGIAGDLANFEEATRALYARDDARLATLVRDWPVDVRSHVLSLAAEAARLEGW